MNKTFIGSALASLIFGVAAHADSLTVEVGYSGPDNNIDSNGVQAGPDTGFVKVTNTGADAEVVTLSLTGVSGNGSYGHEVLNNALTLNLASGGSFYLNANDESSNYGGWNKVPGAADLGILVSVTTDCMKWSAYDSQIFGAGGNNYILQGGSPTGEDFGDTFEQNQQHALIYLTAQCPDSGSGMMLMSGGLAALAALRRKLS